MAGRKPPAYPFAKGPSSVSSGAKSAAGPSRGPMPPSQRNYPAGAGAGASGSTANLLPPGGGARNVSSTSLGSQTPSSVAPSISDKFSLSADPSSWGTDLSANHAEADDYLHNPDPRRDRKNDQGGTVFTARGIANLGFLLLLALGLITLFAGYPIISHFLSIKPTTLGAHGIGGTNASGQVPEISGHFALIDPETPQSALYYTTHKDQSKWSLIFSDEFNTDNRTFYPGDDPYWEAVDLNYWPTGDLEWYDPSALITKDGSLHITLTQEEIHNLSYKSGHMTGWNKFCFTGGYVEVNVSLPGSPNAGGLWPAVWMMGNLGRAGYGATTDGTWPYSYDACDWGTLPNQTFGDLPTAAFTGNDKYNEGKLSFLSGQRLSACTCKNDPNHPGPQRSDGTYYGRMAPEIDIFEAIISGDLTGQVSQSCQYAPFDAQYAWQNTTGTDVDIYNTTNTVLNPYRGAVFQEAVSGLSFTDQNAYEVTGGYALYGVEYQPGDNGYITWFSAGQPQWSMYPPAVGPNTPANISARQIPAEPMYVIMNLGISTSFGKISPDLVFPTTMKIDYVRIYQDPNNRQVGCNPSSHPTEAYINTYIEAYSNPNLTTFSGGAGGSYNQTKPKNRLVDDCD